jgi:hypothetical protein
VGTAENFQLKGQYIVQRKLEGSTFQLFGIELIILKKNALV